jgi:hypothetical protein
MSPRRFRFTARLRRALCVVVASVMALAPVLSTAADSHEAAHSLRGEHHFHDLEQRHEHGSRDEMPDAGELLHGLTHAVHACGHALAILSSVAPSLVAAVTTVRLPELGRTPGDAPRAHPFRPPIA